MTFCRSDKFKILHTWVQYFEFFRSRKGWQNLFQKHEIPVRKKTYFFSKGILVPMSYITYYICIIYVLYMYYICIICVLYVFLLALSGFSWVFCVRGVFCLCFCWLYVAFLGFFASAGFFVRVFAGFMWLFLGFLRPAKGGQRRVSHRTWVAGAGFIGAGTKNKCPYV